MEALFWACFMLVVIIVVPILVDVFLGKVVSDE